MMKKRWILLAAVALVAIGLLAAACGDDDDESTAGDDSANGDITEISMTMSDELAFDPGEIDVRAGERVRLKVENSGSALHDFTIEEIAVDDVMVEGGSTAPAVGHGGMEMAEFDLHLALDGGQSGTLEFTPMEAGDYQFICTETGHADAGMMGTLIVTE